MKNLISALLCLNVLWLSVSGQTLSKETVVIHTSYGEMELKLYEETPLHKSNFIKLVKEGFYDSLLFHRVINYFMIQGGDHLSKKAKPEDSLGHGDIGYTIPAEFKSGIIHKKGALAAARESDAINPKFESSASQFYIVMGKKRTAEDLKKYEDRINKTHYTNVARTFMKSETGTALRQKYNRLKTENKTDSAAVVNSEIEAAIQTLHLQTPEYKFDKKQTEVYTTVGGTPHLDGTYTVFGEVVKGLDIIDKIAAAPTDKRDRPLADIRMKITLVE